MTTTPAASGTHRTLHERRIDLVVGVVLEHSAMDEEAAAILAKDVLYALDHIPENVR